VDVRLPVVNIWLVVLIHPEHMLHVPLDVVYVPLLICPHVVNLLRRAGATLCSSELGRAISAQRTLLCSFRIKECGNGNNHIGGNEERSLEVIASPIQH